MATWPEMRWVERRLGGRRSFAVAVMTAAMVAIILGPIALAVTALIDRADEIAGWTKSLTHLSVPQAPSWVRDVPLVGARITTWWNGIASTPPQELAANITPHLAVIGGWLLGQAGSFVALFVQLLLTLAISAVLYAKGEGAAEWVLAFARRLAGVDGERAARRIVVTALVQSLVGGLGLVVAGVPHAVVLTAVMFLLGIAQIGAMPVMVGAVIWLYWQDQTLWGTVMVVWSVITGTLDNFIRPILIKKGADLPLLLVFAGVLGGLLAFGIIGLFVGPVVLAVSYTLLMAWVGDDHVAAE